MTTKKILSVLICLVMVLSLMPMAAFAAPDDNLCEHHQKHEGCSYVAASDEVKCNHIHTDACMTTTKNCVHDCATAGCTLVPEDWKHSCSHEHAPDRCNYATLTEGKNCTCNSQTSEHQKGCPMLVTCNHIHGEWCGYIAAHYDCKHECTVESKCITVSYENCTHTSHDSVCGYKEATEEIPCNFVCTACKTVNTQSTVQFVNGLSVTLDPDSATYDGSEHRPKIDAVKCDGVPLDSGDYYSPAEFYRDGVTTADFTTAGTIQVRVWGREDSEYANKYGDAYFTIKNPATSPVDSATGLTVTFIDEPTVYNGNPQYANISVSYNGNALTGGVGYDYTVQCLRGTAETQDFTSAGTITVKAIGNTGTAYAGKSGSASYTIAKKPLTVTAKDQTIEYGQDIKPAEYEQSGLITSPVHTLSVKLVADTAKKTITPVVNSIVDNNAGNSVMGNYDIKLVSGTLTINPKVVTTPTIKLDRTSYGYTGKAVTPTVTAVYDGNTLIPASEYTVSYENNVNQGNGTGIVRISDNKDGNYTVSGYTTFTIASNVKYNVVLGNGGCWYRGSYYGLGFRCDGPYADFLGITIDGQPVDKSYYMSSEGSTNVGLYPQLLSMLGNGTHYITFKYTSGSATGVFYVGSTAINAVMTGDDSNVGLLALVMCLGLLSSIATLGVLRKKKSGAR